VRRGKTTTVTGIYDISPDITIFEKIPPPLFGQKGKVELVKVPGPQLPSRFGLQITDQGTQGMLYSIFDGVWI